MQQQALDEYSLRLRQSCRGNCQARAARLERLSAQLRIINPLAVLDRGYSITMRPDGCVIKSGADLRVGDRLITRFARDAVESEVLQNVNIEKNDPDAGL